MENPRVTVIVAAYNAEEWIGEALASIIAQSYCHFEVIVVDDGSTDSTRMIACGAGAKVVSFPHRGVGASRKAILRMVSTPLLMFVDADDVIHRDMLRSMVEVRDKTGAEIVCASVTTRHDKLRCSSEYKLFDGLESAKRVLYQRGIRTGFVAKLLSTDLFDGGFLPPELPIFEDLAFTYRLMAKAEKVAVMPAKMYYYRRGHESLTSTKNPMRLSGLEVTRNIEDTVVVHYPQLIGGAWARHTCAAVGVIGQLSNCHEPNRILLKLAWSAIVKRRAALLRDWRIKPSLRVALLLSFSGRRCFTKICSLWRGRE